MILKVAIFTVAVLAVAYTIRRWHRRELSSGIAVFWSLFWFVVVVFIWMPRASDAFAARIGIGRGIDAAMYLGFLVVFYLFFRVSVKLERLERHITRVVRHLALKDAKRPHPSSSIATGQTSEHSLHGPH